MKKRIRKGKAANDLSVEYFSIRNQGDFQNEYGAGRVYNLSVLWGIQRRIFEKMYINYELGRNIPIDSKNYVSFNEIISELKIGLAF